MLFNKFKSLIILALVTTGVLFSACEIDPITNPNGPTLETLTEGATLADLRLLATGVEAVVRNDMEFYYQTVSIVAREYYDLNGIDPRYTGELLGEQGAQLDNNGFLTTRSFAANYRTVRNCEVLETAVANANAGLSAEEVNGLVGFAETMKAYALLLVLNRQYQNGCRLDVSDPDNLGAFVSYDEGLAGVSDLLKSASDKLSNAGDAFVFNTTIFGSAPTDFLQFTQALAARVELYRGNNTAALSALEGSFLDLAGDMATGAYHTFGAGGNDQFNPLFTIPNQDLYLVHPTWLDDAEAGDTRVDAKTTPLDPMELTVPVILADLSGDTQITLFADNVSPFPIIRNEELILIYAEANIGLDVNEALAGINAVRNAAGLDNYLGATDDASLIDEILNQRRYSLLGEGHRWVDLRRFDRLSEVPLDRPGDIVHEQFPRPVTEN